MFCRQPLQLVNSKTNQTGKKIGKTSCSFALSIWDPWFVKCCWNLEKEEVTFSWKYQEWVLCERNAIWFDQSNANVDSPMERQLHIE